MAGADAHADGQLAAMRFGTAILFCCLILQRFGLPFGGGKAFSLVGPVGLMLMGWGLLSGTLSLHRGRLVAFLALVALALAGVAWHALQPVGTAASVSLTSLSQFLLLTVFACATFTEAVDERRFFREVNRWFAIVAVSGIVQFLVQFVGIRIFTFVGIVPESLLFEAGYNLQIGTGIGEMLKSNGFWLVEPSVFSQVMALALIIEVLSARRVAFLSLFIAGLLMSFSGTGWMVLGSFIVAAGLGMGWRGLAIAAGIMVVGTAVLGLVFTLSPDVGDALYARMDEFSRPGTSGHRRFITPFWLMGDMFASDPAAVLIGLGSGVSEHLERPYAYDVNTPVKVGLDYGLPALAAYVSLFVIGRKSPMQGAMLLPILVMGLFTGGYQQFAPVLFLLLLLTSVARLTAEPPDGHRPL